MCAVSGAIPFSEKPIHVRQHTISFPEKVFVGCFIENFHCFSFCGLKRKKKKKDPSMLEIVRNKFTAKSALPYQSAFSHEEIGMWFPVSGAAHEGYTTVHTVLSVVSNLTALASVGFMFVSYMGFSKDACPFVFSCPA